MQKERREGRRGRPEPQPADDKVRRRHRLVPPQVVHAQTILPVEQVERRKLDLNLRLDPRVDARAEPVTAVSRRTTASQRVNVVVFAAEIVTTRRQGGGHGRQARLVSRLGKEEVEVVRRSSLLRLVAVLERQAAYVVRGGVRQVDGRASRPADGRRYLGQHHHLVAQLQCFDEWDDFPLGRGGRKTRLLTGT